MNRSQIVEKSVEGAFSAKVNFGVAFAAITSAAWLPSLDALSAGAALWVPILGAALLVLQILKLIWDWARKPKA
jgi:hypothetical protein